MDTLIAPINARQQAVVLEKTHHYISLASEIYQKKFQLVEVRFDLSGRNAGMYRLQGKQRWIRYNPYIFARYFDDSLNTTVPHEVAHYITDRLYSLRKIRPHGIEWKNVMRQFGVKPEVTGSYNLDGIPQRKQQRFTYHCDCSQHQISAVRHHRILRQQAVYYCKRCKQALTASPLQQQLTGTES